MTVWGKDQSLELLPKRKCMNKSFCSKVLLFGEYTVLFGGDALAIPCSRFNGTFKYKDTSKHDVSERFIDSDLKLFLEYLKFQERKSNLFFDIDFSRFEDDLNRGLYFDSSIPVGFGVGSSGALTAAFFDKYCKSGNNASFESADIEMILRTDELFSYDFINVKKYFAFLESYFHGSSSGIDPLVSFYNLPIYCQETRFKFFEKKKFLDSLNQQNLLFFLIDSEKSRSTAPLMELFLEKNKSPLFKATCLNQLISYSKKAIEALINSNKDQMFSTCFEISKIQLEYLAPMILPHYVDLWRDGITTKDYALKLCGAGGGGFYLGICEKEKFSKIENHLGNIKLFPLDFL